MILSIPRRIVALCCVCVISASLCFAAEPAPQEMTLWYRQPGQEWLQGLPLGNGLIGAMVFGRVAQERIALNESTFWSGKPHNYDNPKAGDYFKQIGDLVFAGRNGEAERIATDHFMGVPQFQEAYQPIGDLMLAFPEGEATDYRRELDMRTGVAKITYRQGGALFTREVFVSYPDRVMVVRITADQPGRVSVAARMRGQYQKSSIAEGNRLVTRGMWQGPTPGSREGLNMLIPSTRGDGIRYEDVLEARHEGGSVEATSGTLAVRGADSVTLVMSLATSFVNFEDISGDPAARCAKVMDAVAGKDFATLRRRHIADFEGLMGRVNLDLGDPAKNATPTDERLRAVRDGSRDVNLEALCFQFGRYILVASSRAGGQAPGLQGIWNEDLLPPWGAKYTTNINLEMNYWPTEVCNLAECHQPLFDLMEQLAKSGARTAKTYYHAGGWVLHHNTDLWCGTAPVDFVSSGMWPTGGTWLCHQIWEYYLFTGDKEFLRKYYPVMKGAAQFLSDVMVEDPKYHWPTIPFSISPEEGGKDANGNIVHLSRGTTMNFALTRDLFANVIAAEKVLGIDREFRAKLADELAKLPPYELKPDGKIKTWVEDWEYQPGHDSSPTWALFPGDTITLRGTPKLAEGIAKWLAAHGIRSGWPGAVYTCLYARLERGDKVDALLSNYLRTVADNLHNNSRNQSDGSFGMTAGAAEALVQSQGGQIRLLPALPTGWTAGSVDGLRARGGSEVAMTWSDGQLQSATIRASRAATLRVSYGEKVMEIPVEAGQTVRLDGELKTIE